SRGRPRSRPWPPRATGLLFREPCPDPGPIRVPRAGSPAGGERSWDDHIGSSCETGRNTVRLQRAVLRLTPMSDDAIRAPKRFSGWKVAGLIAAILAVLVLTYALYIHSVAERRWADMQQSTLELRSLGQPRNGP